MGPSHDSHSVDTSDLRDSANEMKKALARLEKRTEATSWLAVLFVLLLLHF